MKASLSVYGFDREAADCGDPVATEGFGERDELMMWNPVLSLSLSKGQSCLQDTSHLRDSTWTDASADITSNNNDFSENQNLFPFLPVSNQS